MMKDKTAYYQNGIPQEKYVARFFEQNGLGARLDHNNFDPSIYPFDNHNAVDMVIEDGALFECTNPKETTWMDDDKMMKKLYYFQRKDPFHRLPWFLIVSFPNFSDTIKREINRLGIILIVLNDYATKTNRTTFIRHLYHSQLYQAVKKLTVKKPLFYFISTNYTLTTLPQYYANTESTMKHNNLHQHSDRKTNSIDRVEQAIENFDSGIIEKHILAFNSVL